MDGCVPCVLSIVSAVAGGRRVSLSIIACEKRKAYPKLSHVGHTFGRVSLSLCGRQGRQEQRRQNPDDGDHDQQFDKGEGVRKCPSQDYSWSGRLFTGAHF